MNLNKVFIIILYILYHIELKYIIGVIDDWAEGTVQSVEVGDMV